MISERVCTKIEKKITHSLTHSDWLLPWLLAIPHSPPLEISFANTEEDHDMQLKDQASYRPTSTEEDDCTM